MFTNEDIQRKFADLNAEQQVRALEHRLSQSLAEAIFAIPIGCAEPPVPIPWRTRARWWWYGAREWIAEKLLRVDVGRDESEYEE